MNLEATINNPKTSKWVKLIVAVVAIILWPFTVGGVLSYLLIKKVKQPIVKGVLVFPVVLFTLFFGAAWVSAFVSPSSTRESELSNVLLTNVPSPTIPITTTTPSEVSLQIEVQKPTAAPSITISPTQTPTQTPTPTQSLSPTPTTTPTPTKTPTPTPSPTSTPTPYEVLAKIGKDVAGVNSNVSVFENDDSSVDVINNIQLTPEITLGLDASTRRWVTGFLSKSYTSGQKIRYVLVTVSFLHTGIPAARVGLGRDLAKIYSEEEWKDFTPYDLCNWLKRIQIGDGVDPGDSSYDPSGWAFAKNYKCN